MRQLTREQAIAIAESEVWKSWSAEEIVRFQLYQRRMCMPFPVFKLAMEQVLGRGIYTHEFGSVGAGFLEAEYEGRCPAPTFEEIMALIPPDKLVLIIEQG